MIRILHLEDDALDAELVQAALAAEGLPAEIRRVDRRDEFARALDEADHDVVLADHALPAFDGFSALALVRARRPDTPFIFVSGQMGEETAIDSLRHGATDYVLKSRLGRLAPAVRRALEEAGERRDRQRAQASLAESEARMRAVLDTVGEGIVVIDSSGMIQYVNQEVGRIWGYPAEDLIGQSLQRLMPERYRAAHTAGLARYLETGEARVLNRRLEFEGLRRDGSEFPLELRIVETHTGNAPLFTAAVRDLTEQKRAEAELRESEERYRRLVEFSPDAIFVHRGSEIVFANPAAADLLGAAAPGQLIDRSMMDFVHPAYAEVVRERARTTLEEKRDQPLLEEKFIRLDGTEVDVEVSGIPFAHHGNRTVLLVVRDITQRKRAERDREHLLARLQDERQRIDNIVSTVPGVVWEAWGEPDETQQRIDFVSDYVETMLGYTVDEWLNTPNFWLTIVHPDDREAASRVGRETFLADGRPVVNRFRWMAKDGHVLWVEAHALAILDEGGEPVGMRGVTYDVTNRVRAEQELLRREQQFRALVENTPDIVARFDRELRHLFINPAIERTTGVSPETFMGKNHRELGMPEELVRFWQDQLGRVFETGQEHTIEFDFPAPDGVRSFHSRVVPEFSPDGTVESVLGVTRDLTELRHATDALAEKHHALETIFKTAPLPIITLSVDLLVTGWNPAVERACGWSAPEVLGRINPLVPAEEWAAYAARLSRAERGEVLTGVEAQRLRRDGTQVDVSLNIAPLRDAEGRVTGFVAILEDIGERKRAEEELRASEQRFRQLAENIREVFYISDLRKPEMVYISPAYEEIWGQSRDALYRSPAAFMEAVYPDDRASVASALQLQMRGEATETEYRIRRPDGTEAWIWDRAFPVIEGGQVVRVTGVAEDITERKRAEEALAARARQQAVVASLGQLALAGADLQRLFDEAVREVATTFGVEYCKVLELLPDGKAVKLVAGVGWREGLVGRATVPTSLDSQAGYTLLSKEPVIVEDLRTETRFNGPPLLHDHGVVSGISVVIGQLKSPFGVMGAHTTRRRPFSQDDVNFFLSVANVLAEAIERKRAEQAVRESESRFRAIFDYAEIAVGVISPEGELLESNPASLEMLGYSSDELKEIGVEGISHPDDIARDYEMYARLLNGEINFYRLEKRYICKDGSVMWGDLTVSLARDADGAPKLVISLLDDVTERKQAEEALQSREAQLRALVGSIDDLVIESDADGTYLNIWTANPDVLVRPREEMLGKRVGDLLGEDFARPFLDAFHRVMASGQTEELDYKLDLPRGQRWFQSRINAVPSADGIHRSVSVLSRDITERKYAEEEREQLVRELDAQRALLDSVLNQLPVGVSIAEIPSGRGLYHNREATRLLGHPMVEGEDYTRYAGYKAIRADGLPYSPEEYPTVRAILKGETVHGEEMRYHQDGNDLLLSVNSAPVVDAAGIRIAAVSTFQDITERKRAEEALRQSNRRLRWLSDTANRLLLEERPQELVSDVFRSLSDQLGLGVYFQYAMTEGDRILQLASFGGVPEAVADRAQRLNLGEAVCGKVAVERRRIVVEDVQGTRDRRNAFIRSLGVTAYACHPLLAHGRLIGTLSFGSRERTRFEPDDLALMQTAADQIAMATDRTRLIQELRQETEALASEKERLAVTLRSIGDGVIATDTEGRVVLINPVAEALTGCAQPEAEGRPVDEVLHLIHEESRNRVESPVTRVLASGAVVDLANHTMLVSRDGREHVIADSGAPIRDQEGRVQGVVLVFRDITEKRRLDEEMLRASKLESIGVLAGGIAHDFNNLLTAIVANVSLAKLFTSPQDRIHQRLAEAEKASMRARDLTQQLLTFAKGGAPVRRVTSLEDLLRDSATFALRGSNVQPEFILPSQLWPAEVDEGQISQVIQNLVINAQQAMPAGGTVVLRAANVLIGQDQGLPLEAGPYVTIAIADRGPGISPDHLDRIFDPFFTTKPSGSGLGLATSYAVVHKHGGYLAVESRLGEGTTFSVYLPASPGKRVEPPARSVRVHRGQGRVLVMDDEAPMRETAQAVLSTLGYAVSVAADGDEAARLYREAMETGQPFAVVILDLTVPGGMGGKETVRELQRLDPGVRAIVSSGYSNDPVMADYSAHGFRGVVAKPYSVEELSEVVYSTINDQ